MAFDGNGTFIRTDGIRSGSDLYAQQDAAGVDIETSFMDFAQQDIAEGLTNCITKDGQTTPTANLKMGGFRHTNVSDPTLNNQYETLNDAHKKWTPPITATGTVNALVGTYAPALPVLIDNQHFFVKNSAGFNTSPGPTFNPSGFGNYQIKARGNTSLVINDLGPVGYGLIMRRNTSPSYMELMNPYVTVLPDQVTNTELANMNQFTFKGNRLSPGFFSPQDLTIAEASAADMLDLKALSHLDEVPDESIDRIKMLDGLGALELLAEHDDSSGVFTTDGVAFPSIFDAKSGAYRRFLVVIEGAARNDFTGNLHLQYTLNDGGAYEGGPGETAEITTLATAVSIDVGFLIISGLKYANVAPGAAATPARTINTLHSYTRANANGFFTSGWGAKLSNVPTGLRFKSMFAPTRWRSIRIYGMLEQIN